MEYFICRYSVSTLKILFVDTTVCLFVKELRAFLKLTAFVCSLCFYPEHCHQETVVGCKDKEEKDDPVQEADQHQGDDEWDGSQQKKFKNVFWL